MSSQDSIILESFAVGPIGANCALIACPRTREAFIVDPGGDEDDIKAAVDRLGLRPTLIVLTHAHIDHLLAVSAVAAHTGAVVCLHADDRFLYDDIGLQAAMLGLPAPPALPVPGRWVAHGDRLSAGDLELEVIHTPGHSPGSISLLLRSPAAAPLLFAGDTLFYRSVGRTDLWGGSQDQLQRSIRERLYTLPAETKVIAGHGPTTTIGGERRQNHFIRA